MIVSRRNPGKSFSSCARTRPEKNIRKSCSGCGATKLWKKLGKSCFVPFGTTEFPWKTRENLVQAAVQFRSHEKPRKITRHKIGQNSRLEKTKKICPKKSLAPDKNPTKKNPPPHLR